MNRKRLFRNAFATGIAAAIVALTGARMFAATVTLAPPAGVTVDFAGDNASATGRLGVLEKIKKFSKPPMLQNSKQRKQLNEVTMK